MGTFRIDEYTGAGTTGGDIIPIPDTNITTQTAITTSGTSQQSSAFASGTAIAELYCDTAVHISFGANPTASTSTKYLPAATSYFFSVKEGEKVAVIDAA